MTSMMSNPAYQMMMAPFSSRNTPSADATNATTARNTMMTPFTPSAANTSNATTARNTVMAPFYATSDGGGQPTSSGLQQATGRSSTGGVALPQTGSAIHPHQAAYGAASPQMIQKGTNEIFVAEGTHYEHINGDPANSQIQNYSAEAYNLAQLPSNVVGNAAVFHQYMPQSWSQSSRSQLESLNDSYLHINDAAFQGSFITSAPSNTQYVVQPAQPKQYYNEATGQYSNQPDPWFNVDNEREDNNMTYEQRQRQQVNGNGGSGQSTLQTIEEGYLMYQGGKKAIQGGRVAYETGQVLFDSLEGEGATALGESAIASAESAATSLGFEGAGLATAEALGGAGIIGTGVATLGIGLLVGTAVIGGYEFATHYLGAPTLTQDEKYIGDGVKSAWNAFDDLFN